MLQGNPDDHNGGLGAAFSATHVAVFIGSRLSVVELRRRTVTPLTVRGEAWQAEWLGGTLRVLLINAAFEQFLLSDGSKLTSYDKVNTADGLREATIGRILGFDVITTPWLDNAKATAIGLWTPAVAYVSQVSKTESMRADNTFADRVRGLHVYGAGILRPTAVQVYKAA